MRGAAGSPARRDNRGATWVGKPFVPFVLPVVRVESVLGCYIGTMPDGWRIGSDQNGEAGMRLHFGPDMQVAGRFKVEFTAGFLERPDGFGLESDLCDVEPESTTSADGYFSYVVDRPAGNIHDFVDFNPFGSEWCDLTVTAVVVTRIA